MAVVTRWYGGIKLGAGGLVRAHGGNAAKCLRGAPRCVLVNYVDCGLAFASPTPARSMPRWTRMAIRIDERVDAQGTRVSVRLPGERVAALRERLRDATLGRVRMIAPEAAGRAGSRNGHADGRRVDSGQWRR